MTPPPDAIRRVGSNPLSLVVYGICLCSVATSNGAVHVAACAAPVAVASASAIAMTQLARYAGRDITTATAG